MKQNNTKEILSIMLKLLIICSLVAVIIALVYGITKDKIHFNEMLKTSEALTEIYSDDFGGHEFSVVENSFIVYGNEGEEIAQCNVAECKYLNDVTALYVLSDGQNNSLGYCVSIQPLGFKDVIKMLVAVNSDHTVKGVKIVSMSETSGIGTKAKDESFLSQFIGRDSDSSLLVDTIAGATKTTKPIKEAVSRSIDQVIEYEKQTGKGGAENE